jgi:hypothetical protein
MSQFCTAAGSTWVLRVASSNCLCLSGFSSSRRCIVDTLMSTMLVPTANHPRQGRLPFRVCERMHFCGPPHLRAQAIVLHASLELSLQVVHEADEALATRGVGCECHCNGIQTQDERILRGEHAQHACPQSLERHQHELLLLQAFRRSIRTSGAGTRRAWRPCISSGPPSVLAFHRVRLCCCATLSAHTCVLRLTAPPCERHWVAWIATTTRTANAR